MANINKKILFIILGVFTIAVVTTATTLLIVKPWEKNGEITDNAPIIGTPGVLDVYANTPIEINVQITDDFGVDMTILSYTTDLIAWQNVTMVGTGSTSWTGVGEIPAQDIEVTIHYQIFANDTSNLWSVNNNTSNYFELYTGSRKAIIVSSTNDFNSDEFEEDFNTDLDANFELDWYDHWEISTSSHLIVESGIGPEGGEMDFDLIGPGYHHGNITYDWVGNFYELTEYAQYKISAYTKALNPIVGEGFRVGFQWLDAGSNVIRTDWSDGITDETGVYIRLNATGFCNNDTDNEITNMKLIIDIEGTTDVSDAFFFVYNVTVSKWIPVNLTNPTNFGPPPPPFIDCDGFPAQALQEYWILKEKGYTDDNIFLMIYHKNDLIIDIYANDGIANDLTGAVIDIEDDDVNATRFKNELNVSISNSFASTIQSNDQLIISIIDHGSNALLGDGNATFHFESDNSFITEFEFFELVEEIDCSRMLINVDCCFSGNFIESELGVFYNVPNSIMISSSSNVASWYWINNQNGDGFAGSWFFNQFWDHLSTDVYIIDAFHFAQNFIPFGKGLPLMINQIPMLYDPNNWANTWSFTDIPSL